MAIYDWANLVLSLPPVLRESNYPSSCCYLSPFGVLSMSSLQDPPSVVPGWTMNLPLMENTVGSFEIEIILVTKHCYFRPGGYWRDDLMFISLPPVGILSVLFLVLSYENWTWKETTAYQLQRVEKVRKLLRISWLEISPDEDRGEKSTCALKCALPWITTWLKGEEVLTS